MTTIDREEVKGIFQELMQQNRPLLKEILLEILEEKAGEPVSDRSARVDAIIRRDFDRYHNVFKALA